MCNLLQNKIKIKLQIINNIIKILHCNVDGVSCAYLYGQGQDSYDPGTGGDLR